ncbi:MAG: S26 family signal peptidase [Oscillospiraceae bacterium]|nr:S26 family signal peptidase [Oscillospiraceae bacterium]
MSETTTYEKYLEENGTMTYSNVGVSMMPLLKQGRDLFTVRKKDENRCRKYDVVLYRRPPSSYVLHRVIEVRERDYVILGDNCINKEYGITDDDIIGVMTEYVHNGKKHTVKEFGYRLYSHIWVDFASVRVFFMRVKFKLKRLIGR